MNSDRIVRIMKQLLLLLVKLSPTEYFAIILFSTILMKKLGNKNKQLPPRVGKSYCIKNYYNKPSLSLSDDVMYGVNSEITLNRLTI